MKHVVHAPGRIREDVLDGLAEYFLENEAGNVRDQTCLGPVALHDAYRRAHAQGVAKERRVEWYVQNAGLDRR
eukprot:scaffold117936_cov63-Phaeocystis_antarctica.AAC.4